tara:strand:- start:14 stop:397 length:384 start_codon:yes stop_codon:yes gene_type:complete
VSSLPLTQDGCGGFQIREGQTGQQTHGLPSSNADITTTIAAAQAQPTRHEQPNGVDNCGDWTWFGVRCGWSGWAQGSRSQAAASSAAFAVKNAVFCFLMRYLEQKTAFLTLKTAILASSRGGEPRTN